MQKKIAFITYETPFAPGGGISAVMKYLPSHVKQACELPTFVITPFHQKISRTTSLLGDLRLLGKIQIDQDKKTTGVEVFALEQDITWIFLRPEDEEIFAGIRHPYDVGRNQEEIKTNLLRDALFFGSACAQSLPLIDNNSAWRIFLQDWEASTAIFSLMEKRARLSFKAFLTIHNSYDMPVRDSHLLRMAIKAHNFPGETILQRTLPFVEDPVFTVSEQFAYDLTNDPLQTHVMAPHLLDTLSDRLLGVDNGLFSSLKIDPDLLVSSRKGDFNPLDQWKEKKRTEALQALTGFSPSPDKPVWGNPTKFRQNRSPWFIMAGRDDPRQKGYDLAFQAISSFLAAGGQACFLIFPIPGDEGLDGLKFFQTLAIKYPENVLVLPFLFQEGYLTVLQGASFGMMPSYYEPFGMANEFYLNGAVGIGRATGGILQQIVPLRSAASFSQAVKLRADNYYSSSSSPTGILFREKDGIPSAISDWKEIARSEYKIDGSGVDRIQQRSSLRLFAEMVSELNISIKDGVRLYYQDPTRYNSMLIDGIDYLIQTFSWQRTAQTYLRYGDIK